MSTIHCAIDWQTSLPDHSLQEMLSCSDYWRPDAVNSKQISGQPDVQMAKANLFNRPHSEFDTILMSECGHYSIVANAHLDNRDELARQLQLKEVHRLSDGELILKAYEYWQESCASHLVGDFVFILWDNVKQQLYCARDHFGVKSLFYSMQAGRVILSNEHKSLLTPCLGVSRKLSHRWLADVFMPTTGNEFLSPFEAIHTLPAAHQLVITQQGHRCEPYWTLQPQTLPLLSDDEYIAKLSSLFEQAVARRLVTNYPVAAELSEGLDSNSVVGYASRLLGDKPLYTMSFNGTALNEENAAIWAHVYQELFDAMELWSNVQPLWNDTEVDILRAGVHAKTFGGPSVISSWYDSRCMLAQSQGCKTILSGWGGDHCVSGYGDEYIDELFLSGRYIALYHQLKLRQQRGRGGKPIKAMVRLLVQRKFPPIYKSFFKLHNRLAKQSAALFNAPLLSESVIENLANKIMPYFEAIDRTSVQDRDHRELIEVGVQRRMTLTEIAARHFRCEFRYPLLDKDLVEFAYSLPSHLKCKYGIERYMFREMLRGHTTERIRMRRKVDVLTSVDVCKLRGCVDELLEEVLAHWSPELDMIFNRTTLEQAAQDYPHVVERHLLLIKSLRKQLESGAIHT